MAASASITLLKIALVASVVVIIAFSFPKVEVLSVRRNYDAWAIRSASSELPNRGTYFSGGGT
jgi:hypothetical protein